MSHAVIVVAEAPDDAACIRRFTETLVGVEAVSWLSAPGDVYEARCILWRHLRKATFGERRPRMHGRFGRGGSAPRSEAEKALRHVEQNYAEARAVMLVHDDDGKDRRGEFVAACATANLPVVLALPNPEIEAWFIRAYRGRGQQQLDGAKRRIGFDPRKEPDRMTSTSGAHDRDCKVIWSALAAAHGDADDALEVVLSAAEEVLSRTAAASGLPAFCADVKDKLSPLANETPPSR